MPCAQEVPVLRTLKQQGVLVWGIAYKDAPTATSEFLQRAGDPYAHVARDEEGTAGSAFGLNGVPETFMVDALGTVRGPAASAWNWCADQSSRCCNGSRE